MVRESHPTGFEALSAFEVTHPCHQTHHLHCLAELLSWQRGSVQLTPEPYLHSGAFHHDRNEHHRQPIPNPLARQPSKKASHLPFCQVQYTSSIIPLPISATPTASSKPPETDIPNKHNNTTVAAQQRSSTAARHSTQHGEYPPSHKTHTHTAYQTSTHARHPTPSHHIRTTHHTTQTHTLAFTPESAAAK